MSKTVILAEKPSQASAYAEAFDKFERKDGYFIVSNNQYSNAIITYGFGHLVSLISPDEYNEEYKTWKLDTLPIIPAPFKFTVTKDKLKQYNIVKKHLDEADEIIIATDLDREGEAIARYMINHSNNQNKEIKRLWINSLEVEGIKTGFNNLKNGNETYGMYTDTYFRANCGCLSGISPIWVLKSPDGSIERWFRYGWWGSLAKKMQEEGLGVKDIETYRDDLQLQFELINHKNPHIEKELSPEEELKEFEEAEKLKMEWARKNGRTEEEIAEMTIRHRQYFEELMNRR